jgi:hypothetical protein
MLRLLEVQIIEAQLTDLDSNSCNKPDKSPPHDWKSTQ